MFSTQNVLGRQYALQARRDFCLDEFPPFVRESSVAWDGDQSKALSMERSGRQLPIQMPVKLSLTVRAFLTHQIITPPSMHKYTSMKILPRFR